MDKKLDVVVVGGGLAGLAAAAVAARAGAAVRLLERSGEPGGRARTRDREGFLFNVGPHALFGRGAGRGVLRELGVAVPGRVPRYNGLALLGDAVHALPTGPRSLLGTRLLSARGKVQVARMLGRLQRGTPATRAGETFETWLAAQGLRPDAAGLLRTLVRVSTYCDDLARVDAGAGLAQLRLGLTGGVLYLDGGWQTLVSGLRRAAAESGAEVITGAPAQVVEAGESGVRGVRDASGRLHEAASVVLAVGPDEAARLAGAISPALRTSAGACTPARVACLDLGLRALPRPDRTFALGIDRPLYLSVHSASARLAPEGAALVHAMRYLGPDRPAPSEVERELEHLVDRVQPGWREQVQVRRFVPDLVVANDVPRAGGLARRPPVAVADVRGLLVAGDWVGAEGLLADASLASGARAARTALRETRERAA